jgi:hypothetical protein
MLQSDLCATPLHVLAQRTYRTNRVWKKLEFRGYRTAGTKVDGIDGRAETIVDSTSDTWFTKFLVAELQRVKSVIKK